MGSYRAKNASISELLKAHARGILPGMLKVDQGNREAILRALNNWGWDDSLELYLPFNETAGQTAFDLSGNANTGTATGTTIVDGVFGKARNFDGTDDNVDCGAQANLIPSKITMECWFKGIEFSGGDRGIITNKSCALNGLNLCIKEAYLKALLGNGGTYAYLSSGVAPVVDTWYQAVVTHNDADDENQIFVNGELKGTMTFAVDYGSPTPNTIVGFFYTDGYGLFYGLIDGVRIYSRVLSADEIYLHYLAGALKLGLI